MSAYEWLSISNYRVGIASSFTGVRFTYSHEFLSVSPKTVMYSKNFSKLNV